MDMDWKDATRNQVDSATSRVLRTAELLELVMSALNDDEASIGQISRPTSQYLLWAALTCRDFFNPAMNVLWRVMESWVPIVGLIDVVTEADPDYEEDYMTEGPIYEKHLERMDSYTQRIRHFIVCDSSKENMVKISPHIFMYLSEIRHSRLFPAIKNLTIPNLRAVELRDLPSLWLIPSPTLSEVDVGGIVANGVAGTLLEKMSRSSPGIQKIMLEGAFELDPLADILQRFANLKKLSLYMGMSMDISAHVLDTFSRLNKLQDLRLFMDMDAEFTPSNSNNHKRAAERDNNQPCFDSLGNFYITAQPNTALSILNHLPALKKVSRFSVFLLNRNHVVAPRFLQKILRICPSTLRHLTLSSDGDSNGDAPVTLDAGFRSFLGFPFSFLETLDIRVDRVDKELLVAFASSSFKQTLKDLRLNRECTASLPACHLALSASEVGLIAEIFPNLQYFHVALFVDMSDSRLQEMRRSVRSLDTTKSGGQKRHPLSELSIFPLMLPDSGRPRQMMPESQRKVRTAYAFARYLHAFFPRLRTLYIGMDGLADLNWSKNVSSLINEFFDEEQFSENELHAAGAAEGEE